MRWIPLVILIYLVVLVQTTIAQAVTVNVPWVGSISPDLAAVVTVFLALHAASGPDAMLAGWLLGLAVDLTAAGGPGAATVVGPMALVYALAAGGLFRAREALFHEHALTQTLLALVFCLFTHGVWLTSQALLHFSDVLWSHYFRMLMQVVLSAAFSAALTPLVYYLLGRCRRWFVAVPAVRRSGRAAGRHRR